MFYRLLCTLLVGVLDSSLSVIGAELDAAECLELGFNSAKLLCSSCDDLKQFDLGSLSADCANCCTRDAGSASLENTKYERAILEVCGWRLGAYPQVAAFIKSERPARYPGLTIKYVRGADPIIKLLDEEEEVVETLAIDKWNTDSVEEFLDTVMVRADAETAGEVEETEEDDHIKTNEV